MGPGLRPTKPSGQTRPEILKYRCIFSSLDTLQSHPFCPPPSQLQTKGSRHSTAHVRGTSLSPKPGAGHSLGMEEARGKYGGSRIQWAEF